MADIIARFTDAQLQQILYNIMSRVVFDMTGEVWDATDSDGAALTLEAMAVYVGQLREEFNTAADNLRPTVDSPYLDDVAAIFGLTRNPGESNASLFQRITVARQQASLGSPDNLTIEVQADFPDVQDIGFDGQDDGVVNVYLISSALPEGNALEGVPSTMLATNVIAFLNNNRRHHVGSSFAYQDSTATEYSIVVTVHYDAEVRPDTTELQEELRHESREFVRHARVLGGDVALSQLHDVLHAVEGVSYVTGTFYTGDLSGSPTAIRLLDATNDMTYFTCAAEANFVDNLAAATTGQVNIILDTI